MYVQIAKDQFINLSKVAYIERSGSSEHEGVSYMFYGDSKKFLAQTDFGSPYNHDVEKAIDKAREF